jgi:transcriptional regulator with XRE-family HTH domain
MNRDEIHFLRSLGDRLRQHRIDRGWTQEQLAERCDLHRTFIGSVERGERNISILNLKHIARILRVPLSGLFAEQTRDTHSR